MKSRDGKEQPGKKAANALPGVLKSSEVKSTVDAINKAVARRGLKKKPGEREN